MRRDSVLCSCVTPANWFPSFLQHNLAHICSLLHTFEHFCSLLHTFAHIWTLSHTFAHFCTPLHNLAHFCTLAHTYAHLRTLTLHTKNCTKNTQNTVQCRVYINCTLCFLSHFCTAAVAGEWNRPSALLLVIICSSVADNVYKIIITTSWFSVTFVGSMAGDQEIIYSLNQLIRKNRWSERFFM